MKTETVLKILKRYKKGLEVLDLEAQLQGESKDSEWNNRLGVDYFKEKEKTCEWKLEDEEANLYLTECQQRQLIFDGTPKENEYRYCPYCGKKIKVVK